MVSSVTQNHPGYMADGHPRRTGQRKHQTPNATSKAFMAAKFQARSSEITPR